MVSTVKWNWERLKVGWPNRPGNDVSHPGWGLKNPGQITVWSSAGRSAEGINWLSLKHQASLETGTWWAENLASNWGFYSAMGRGWAGEPSKRFWMGHQNMEESSTFPMKTRVWVYFSHIITNMEKTIGDVSYVIYDNTMEVSVNLLAFLSQLQERAVSSPLIMPMSILAGRIKKKKSLYQAHRNSPMNFIADFSLCLIGQTVTKLSQNWKGQGEWD